MREPKFEERAEQPYVGKRVVMPMRDFPERVPALTDEVAEWMDKHGVAPTGKPFLRYLVIDMPDRIDVEVTFPVEQVPDVDGLILRGTLPAGRYATLAFIGVENGIPANKRLIDWIEEQGETMDAKETDDGQAFVGRVEILLTDPNAEPDQRKWETQVAIKVF